MHDDEDKADSKWQFKGESDNSEDISAVETGTLDNSPANPEVDPISWTASEFIQHEKGVSWYLKLAAGTLGVAGLVYVLTHDRITTGMIILVAIFFGILASRKPQVVSYGLNDNGVIISEKTYPWSAFKSFSILEEATIGSIYLSPLKRFMPPIGMYFEPKDENQILQVLESYLPRVERSHDPIDRLMHRVRF